MKNVSQAQSGRMCSATLQQCCFMSQHLLGVKTWFRAPNAMLTEVIHLCQQDYQRLACKNDGDFVRFLLLKELCVWSFLGGNATCNIEWGLCTASPESSRLIAIIGISETRITSLHLNDENLSVFSWEMFHLAFPNSCLQLFHNNSNN